MFVKLSLILSLVVLFQSEATAFDGATSDQDCLRDTPTLYITLFNKVIGVKGFFYVGEPQDRFSADVSLYEPIPELSLSDCIKSPYAYLHYGDAELLIKSGAFDMLWNDLITESKEINDHKIIVGYFNSSNGLKLTYAYFESDGRYLMTKGNDTSLMESILERLEKKDLIEKKRSHDDIRESVEKLREKYVK